MGPMSQAEQFGAEQVRAEQRSLFVEEVPERTYGVGELAAGITRAVSAAFPAEIWVRGELSGLKPANASGHVYFSLSERSSRRGPTSTIGVALFRTDRLKVERFLRDWPGFALADGIEVRIRGRVQYAYGRISVVMSAVDPVHTLGRLAADRDRVLRALAADGLLEANGRLALPAMPLRVGLVTSAGSAACEDVLAELRASGFGFRWPPGRRPGPGHRGRGLVAAGVAGAVPAPGRRHGGGARGRCPHRPGRLRRRAAGPGRGRHVGARGQRRGPRDRHQRGRRGGPHRVQDAHLRRAVGGAGGGRSGAGRGRVDRRGPGGPGGGGRVRRQVGPPRGGRGGAGGRSPGGGREPPRRPGRSGRRAGPVTGGSRQRPSRGCRPPPRSGPSRRPAGTPRRRRPPPPACGWGGPVPGPRWRPRPRSSPWRPGPGPPTRPGPWPGGGRSPAVSTAGWCVGPTSSPPARPSSPPSPTVGPPAR